LLTVRVGGEPGSGAERLAGDVQQAEHAQDHQAPQHQHGHGACHHMPRQAQT
jgi:hypothetical protein